ncbi:unnamed protein product [Prunus armeniaca]
MPMIDLNEEEGGEGCEREEVKVARKKELKKKAIWDRPRCPSSRPSGPRTLVGWPISRPWSLVTFPINFVMLGLRYALGLGRARDLHDNKRSVRPRVPDGTGRKRSIA